MAQNLAELCIILIKTHLGELSAQIFATLAEYGRQTAPTLANHASVPLRRAKTGLTTLMEVQLVMHYTAEEDTPTYYSVSWRNAYNLARHTNIIQLVTERQGEAAGQIVRNILQLGHARVGDLTGAYEFEAGSKRDSGIDISASNVSDEGIVNGIAKSGTQSTRQHIKTAGEFHSILNTLLESGILAKVGSRGFVPPADLQEQLEETVINEQFPDRKVTGPKKAREFAAAVERMKREWQAEDRISEVEDYTSRGAIKRPGDHFQGPNKRVKIDGGLPNGHDTGGEEAGPMLSSHLVLRVDFARCVLALRSQRLEQLARRSLGSAAGAVYAAILRVVEKKARGLRDDLELDEDAELTKKVPVATLNEIAEVLDPSVDLGTTIKGVGQSNQLTNGTGKKGKRLDPEFADIGIKQEDSDSEDDARNGFRDYTDRSKHLRQIEAHLMLLEEHNKHFCRRAKAGSNSQEWLVDFPTLTGTLIDAELDATISARHGSVFLRITRMLREKGKLDEKQVAALAMMRMKDVRNVLTELQFQHVIEAQELPKDNRRQPSNTLYYWYFDTQRVQSLVLQQTYKAMTRTLQRIPVERGKFRTVIDKAERTDIQGYEEMKLAAGEMTALRQWRDVEERLLAQVARMDDVVATLRDFPGSDTEMAT